LISEILYLCDSNSFMLCCVSMFYLKLTCKCNIKENEETLRNMSFNIQEKNCILKGEIKQKFFIELKINIASS